MKFWHILVNFICDGGEGEEEECKGQHEETERLQNFNGTTSDRSYNNTMII